MDTTAYQRLLQLLSTLLIETHTLQMLVRQQLSDNENLDGAQQILTGNLLDMEQMEREAIYILRADLEIQRPAELEQSSLADVLSHLVEETAERMNISSRVAFSGVDAQGRSLGRQLSTTAERLCLLLAHEALYQIEQHLDVHRLRLTLSYDQEYALLGLEDDGLVAVEHAPQDDQATGILALDRISPYASVPPDAERSILDDLRQRIALLGGSLEVIHEEERGTRFLLHMPYTTAPELIEARDAVSRELEATTGEPPVRGRVQATTAVVSVLIVDGQTVSRAGLRRLIESYPGFQVVGEATDGVQAVSETLELGPQVVLMDAQLPEGQSLEALRQIKQLNLDTHVLLLATQDREEYLYETLRAGADGYVLKDIVPDELAEALRRVARGETLIQSQIAGRLLSRFGKQRRGSSSEMLTTREQEVLRLLARGLRNKEIATRLYVSERTVNFHLANIYQKLNVSGRTEALSKALEQGLITP